MAEKKQSIWSQEDLDRLDQDLADNPPPDKKKVASLAPMARDSNPVARSKSRERRDRRREAGRRAGQANLRFAGVSDPGSTTSMQEARAGVQLPFKVMEPAVTAAQKVDAALSGAVDVTKRAVSKVAEKTPRPIKAALSTLDPREGILPVAKEQIKKQGAQMMNTSEAAPDFAKDAFAAKGEHLYALAGADDAEIEKAKETFGGDDREIGFGDRMSTELLTAANYLPGVGAGRYGVKGAALISNAIGETMNPYGTEDIRSPLGRFASGLVGGKLFNEGIERVVKPGFENVVKPGIKSLPEIADVVAGTLPGTTRGALSEIGDATDQGFRTTADMLDNALSDRTRRTLKQVASLDDKSVKKASRHAREALDRAFPAKATPEELKQLARATPAIATSAAMMDGDVDETEGALGAAAFFAMNPTAAMAAARKLAPRALTGLMGDVERMLSKNPDDDAARSALATLRAIQQEKIGPAEGRYFRGNESLEDAKRIYEVHGGSPQEPALKNILSGDLSSTNMIEEPSGAHLNAQRGYEVGIERDAAKIEGLAQQVQGEELRSDLLGVVDVMRNQGLSVADVLKFISEDTVDGPNQYGIEKARRLKNYLRNSGFTQLGLAGAGAAAALTGEDEKGTALASAAAFVGPDGKVNAKALNEARDAVASRLVAKYGKEFVSWASRMRAGIDVDTPPVVRRDPEYAEFVRYNRASDKVGPWKNGDSEAIKILDNPESPVALVDRYQGPENLEEVAKTTFSKADGIDGTKNGFLLKDGTVLSAGPYHDDELVPVYPNDFTPEEGVRTRDFMARGNIRLTEDHDGTKFINFDARPSGSQLRAIRRWLSDYEDVYDVVLERNDFDGRTLATERISNPAHLEALVEKMMRAAPAAAGLAAAATADEDSDVQRAMGLGLIGSVKSFGKGLNFGGRVTAELVQEAATKGSMQEAYDFLASQSPKFAKYIKKVDEVYNQIATPEMRARLLQLYNDGAAKGEIWYDDARASMNQAFPNDPARGADLVAHFSQQQEVGKDLQDAMIVDYAKQLGYDISSNFDRRLGGVSGLRAEKLEKVLAGAGVAGGDARKIVEYAEALTSDPKITGRHGVVNDRHIGAIFDLSMEHEHNYDAVERLIVEMANELETTPEKVQARIWMGHRDKTAFRNQDREGFDLYSEWLKKPGNVEKAKERAVALGELDNNVIKTHMETGGSTFDPRTGRNMAGEDMWAIPASKDTEWVLDEPPTPDDIAAFRLFNRELLSDPKNFVGTWHNKADNKHYLDVSQLHPTREAALDAGAKGGQIAAYHLKSGEEALVPFKPSPAAKALQKKHSPFVREVQKLVKEFAGDARAVRKAMRERFGEAGNPLVRDMADMYVEAAGIERQPYSPVLALDEATHRAVADFYDKAVSTPDDPEVQAAYEAFRREAKQQYDFIRSMGIEIVPTVHDPYRNSAEMMQDVLLNKRLQVFADPNTTKHELLDHETQVMFRAVHDFFGHSQNGNQFGAVGEENAFRDHYAMFSPEAQKAMASETRGQNSWVNFGPNSHLPVKERPFADQKSIILPEELRAPYAQAAATAAGVAGIAALDDQETDEGRYNAAAPVGLALFLARPKKRTPQLLAIRLSRLLSTAGIKSLEEIPEEKYVRLWSAVNAILQKKGASIEQDVLAATSQGTVSLKQVPAFSPKVLTDLLLRLPESEVDRVLTTGLGTPTSKSDAGVKLPDGFDPMDLSFAAPKPGGAAGGVIAEDAAGNQFMVKSGNWASNPLAEHTTFDIARRLWPEVPYFESRYVGGLEGRQLGDRLADEYFQATSQLVDPFKGRGHGYHQPNPPATREFFIRPLAPLIGDVEHVRPGDNTREITGEEVDQVMKGALIQSIFSNTDLHSGNLVYLKNGDLAVLDAGFNLRVENWSPLLSGFSGIVFRSAAAGQITVGDPIRAMREIADATTKLSGPVMADIEREIARAAERWWDITDSPDPSIDAAAEAAVLRLKNLPTIVDKLERLWDRSKADKDFAEYELDYELEQTFLQFSPVIAALGATGYFASKAYNEEKDDGLLAELADDGHMGQIAMAALGGFAFPKGLSFKQIAAAARKFVKEKIGRAPQLDAVVDQIVNAPDEDIVEQVFNMMRQPNIIQRLGGAEVIGDVPRNRGILPPQDETFTNAELGWAQTPEGGKMREASELGIGPRMVASNFIEPEIGAAYQKYTDALYVLDRLFEQGKMPEKLYESAKRDWRRWHSRQLLSASYLESAKLSNDAEGLMGVLQAAEQAMKDGRLPRRMFAYIVDTVDLRFNELRQNPQAVGAAAVGGAAALSAMSPEDRENAIAAAAPLLATVANKKGNGPLSKAHTVVEEAGEVLRLIRYMKKPGLDVIDPNDPNIRTDVPGEEWKRRSIPGFMPRANFYREGVRPEQMVTQVAPFKYEVEVPREKIANPDQTTEIVQEMRRTRGYFDPTEFEEIVSSRGFMGYENLNGYVAIFDPVKVKQHPHAQPGFAATELTKAIVKLGGAGTLGLAASEQEDDAPFRGAMMLGAGLLTVNAFGGYKAVAAGAKAAQDGLNAVLTNRLALGKERGNRTMRYLFNGYGIPEAFQGMLSSARRQLAAEESMTLEALRGSDLSQLAEEEGASRMRLQQLVTGQIKAKGNLGMLSGTPIYQRYSELTKKIVALGMSTGPQNRHLNIHDYHTDVVVGELMHGIHADPSLWQDGPMKKSIRKLAREELKAKRKAGAAVFLGNIPAEGFEAEIERITRSKTADEIRRLRAEGYERVPNALARRTPLRGKWVRKDIIDEIQRVYDTPKRIKKYGETFQRLHTIWKRFHTVDNPATHVTNVVSNMVTGEMSGVLPLHDPRTWKHMNHAYRELTDWLSGKKVSADVQQALDLGMLQGDLQGINEFSRVQSVLAQARRVNSPSKLAKTFGEIGKAVGSVGHATQTVYQFEEQLFKFATYKRAISRGSTPEEAVKLAEKWFFDYSDVSPLIEDLRTQWWGIPFITWSAKMFPRMVELAADHPIKAMAALGALTAVSQAGIMPNVKDEDLPWWMRYTPGLEEGRAFVNSHRTPSEKVVPKHLRRRFPGDVPTVNVGTTEEPNLLNIGKYMPLPFLQAREPGESYVGSTLKGVAHDLGGPLMRGLAELGGGRHYGPSGMKGSPIVDQHAPLPTRAGQFLKHQVSDFLPPLAPGGSSFNTAFGTEPWRREALERDPENPDYKPRPAGQRIMHALSGLATTGELSEERMTKQLDDNVKLEIKRATYGLEQEIEKAAIRGDEARAEQLGAQYESIVEEILAKYGLLN
jgi:hypothetical protein